MNNGSSMVTQAQMTATMLVEVRVSVTHYAPQSGAATTECCGHTPFELKRTDRLTNDPALVTCPGAWMARR